MLLEGPGSCSTFGAFSKVMDRGFFLLLILVALRFAVFSFRNPRYLYLFNLPWQLVVSVNRP